MSTLKFLGITGSLRHKSTNKGLLRAAMSNLQTCDSHGFLTCTASHASGLCFGEQMKALAVWTAKLKS